jgi:hypothetical protein
MRKFLLSGLICIPVFLLARLFSDTFECGVFAGFLYVALDIHFIEGRKT